MTGLEALTPELVFLDFLLYTFVAAVGPLWLCSWSVPKRAWNPPPKGVLLILALTRCLLVGRAREPVLTGSVSAQIRSAINGWVVFPLAFACALGLYFMAEVGLVPVAWAAPFFDGSPMLRVLAWLFAVVFLAASFLLVSRAVARGLLCSECASAVGFSDHGCGQDCSNDYRQDEEKRHQQPVKHPVQDRSAGHAVFLSVAEPPHG